MDIFSFVLSPIILVLSLLCFFCICLIPSWLLLLSYYCQYYVKVIQTLCLRHLKFYISLNELYVIFTRGRQMIKWIGECFTVISLQSWRRSSVVINNNLYKVGCLLKIVHVSLYKPLRLILTLTGKAKIERVSYDIKVKYGMLESARSTVLHIFLN